jgi:DNA-directed RNA polymerase specialized sigma24 family protein
VPGDHARAGEEPPQLAKVIPLHPAIHEAMRSLLGLAGTRRLITSIVKDRVPEEEVDDIVQSVMAEALRAPALPYRTEALLAWLATIARRQSAQFLRKRARRAKYEGPMPDDAPDVDDEVFVPRGLTFDPNDPSDDPELEAQTKLDWLRDEVAGDVRDHETLDMILEHYVGKKTYAHIAEARELPLTAVSWRIFAFKTKYIPRYKRWRRQRALLLIFFALGVAALVAVLASVFWPRARREPIGPDPAPPPAPPSQMPTRTLAPPFEPALPTEPSAPTAPPVDRSKPSLDEGKPSFGRKER